ncbi:O-antigen ligase family protein [Arenimonas sp.]|uniref:O-antigen ligase family protein n=1 Tax=Arenimonas sp. TaxID=1872635 RepID=UPI0039E52B2D
MYLLLGLSFLFSVRALIGWRKGILLMIVLAALQDPLRKLVPGTPGWLVLVTAPVFVAAVVTSVGRTRHWWGEFRQHFPSIGKSLQVLAVLSLPAAFISATYGRGSWMLTLLGAFSYSILFLGMIAGYHYARSLQELRKLLATYCIVHGLVLIGGILEGFGYLSGWKSIGTDALGYDWIRWGTGYTVDMIAGFYRSADVMGWHAAAVFMMCLVLGMTGKGKSRRGWLLWSMVAVTALLLCGRRKMVYMLPVFVVALVWIYWQAGRSSRVIAIVSLLAIPFATVWLASDALEDRSANIRYYQGEGIQESLLSRIEGHGFSSVAETYRQSGFFGEGLGTATPGSHHLKVERPRVWQESTTSRIMVELGVPGMLGFFAVMVTVVLCLWRETMKQLREKSLRGQYAAGLLAFFLANVGSLTISGQILADPFIAAFLGFLVGLTLSISRLALPQPPVRRRPVQPYEPAMPSIDRPDSR